MSRAPTLARAVVAEVLGTAFLLAAVVGSGIMAEKLSGGNSGLALLANAIATGGALVALILTYGPISGAHFNPIVTLSAALRRLLGWKETIAYLAAQIVGAVLGVWLAHFMFGLPIIEASGHARSTVGEWGGEFVATFGLIGLIIIGNRHSPGALPYAIAAYITGAYWFTSSTSFANPAVTIARAMTDTFAGIEFGHVPGFILAQVLGALAATVIFEWMCARQGP